MKDNVLLIHSSSNKTYDEEKVLELEAGEETVKKEHLYLNRAQSDSKKPTITSVKQKGERMQRHSWLLLVKMCYQRIIRIIILF